MKPTIIRIAVIGCVSFLTGLIANQIHPQGIGWRLLLLSAGAPSGEEAWNPVSVDSAFVHFMMQDALFIDLRPREEFELDHIPGARSVPFHSFFRNPAIEADPGETLILYAFEPMSTRPRLMVRQLLKMGFSKVMFIRNGFSAWLERGFPAEGDGP